MIVLILHLHYLDGKLLFGCLMHALLDHSVSTLSDFLLHAVRYLKGLFRALLVIFLEGTFELEGSSGAANAFASRAFFREGIQLFFGGGKAVDCEIEVVQLLVPAFAK